MKFKGMWFAKLFVLALGLVAAMPISSYAETARGKFTLASETHWGTAVLPAGQYEFSVESSHAPTIVLVRSAMGKPVAMLVSQWTAETTSDAANSLQLENRGDETFVSSMILGAQDIEMHFSVPAAKETLAQTAKQTSAVPGFAQ